MPDTWRPSRCPILDLGVKLEPHDPRDPWRRMPRLFQRAVGVLGRGLYNHDARSRRDLEVRLGHYCRMTREGHGPCSLGRVRLCHAALHGQLSRAATVEPAKRRGAAYAGITRLLTDETHQAALKGTRVKPAPDGLRMPPISLESMPDV